MRAPTLGAGLLLGLVIIMPGAPVASAGDYGLDHTADSRIFAEPDVLTGGSFATTSIALGEAYGVQLTPLPDGAPRTHDEPHGVSPSLLMVGLGLGALAGVGAIVLREGRR